MGTNAANICSKALRSLRQNASTFLWSAWQAMVGASHAETCGWPDVRAVQVLSMHFCVYTTAVHDVVGSASRYAPSKVSLQPSQGTMRVMVRMMMRVMGREHACSCWRAVAGSISRGSCTGWPQPRSVAHRTCWSSAAPMMDTVHAHTSCGSNSYARC